MITINFEAASGADLRKEMLDLLGITGDFGAIRTTISAAELRNVPFPKSETLFKDEENVKPQVDIEVEVRKDATNEVAKPEQPTRKRRSKAEIESEAAALAANTGTEEPPASTENVETPTVEYYEPITGPENDCTVITAEDLTKKCVELGREGKRDAVLAIFESQFGGATISKKDGKPQLTADQYPAVMEALNAIA